MIPGEAATIWVGTDGNGGATTAVPLDQPVWSVLRTDPTTSRGLREWAAGAIPGRRALRWGTGRLRRLHAVAVFRGVIRSFTATCLAFPDGGADVVDATAAGVVRRSLRPSLIIIDDPNPAEPEPIVRINPADPRALDIRDASGREVTWRTLRFVFGTIDEQLLDGTEVRADVFERAAGGWIWSAGARRPVVTGVNEDGEPVTEPGPWKRIGWDTPEIADSEAAAERAAVAWIVANAGPTR